MADAYLNMAEHILSAVGCPLKPKEIMQQAFASEALPWHLHGARQDKTLHARLSEDIAINKEQSRFYRTAPGRFFLRNLLDDASVPQAYKTTYLAPRRSKELVRDKVLCFLMNEESLFDFSGTILDQQLIQQKIHDADYTYATIAHTKENSKLIQLHSFVLVYNDDMVLSFRCGKFRSQDDPIYGLRSIGIGGCVLASDVDLLFDSKAGVISSGINELVYGVGLPRKLAEDARYNQRLEICLGVISHRNRKNGAVLHVVLSYKCPSDFHPTKSALSINDLRWVSITNPGNNLKDFDQTSQRIFALAKAGFLKMSRTP